MEPRLKRANGRALTVT